LLMLCEKCSTEVNILRKKYNRIMEHVFRKNLGGIGAICKECAKASMSVVYTTDIGGITYLEDLICETPPNCKVIFKNNDARDCWRGNLILCLVG